tara:strand:- start:21 stop:761 length:741 start_codon:yes stop_codon:yes gene_type:complete
LKINFLDYSAEDPKIDLNIEEYLLENVKLNPDSVWLRFWRGRDSVILGKSQNIREVCNIENCIKDNIGVYRRFSGGGAVFHDFGNLNIAIALDRKKWNLPLDPKKSFEWLSLIIQRFLNQNGLKSSTARISDIMASDGKDFKKVSGTAQARRGSALLWHSTLMVDTPVHKIVKYLPIPPDRPGIRHQDYVTNLKKLKIEKNFKSIKSEITNITTDFFQLDCCSVDFESSIKEELTETKYSNLLDSL